MHVVQCIVLLPYHPITRRKPKDHMIPFVRLI